MKVDFFKHSLGVKEKNSFLKALNSKFLSIGPLTQKFEKKFSNYLKAKYCLGVSNWTTGNLILLKAFNIGFGDEVITTPMTFIATSNTIIQVGAKPIFVDVEKETGNININAIQEKITDKTKAIFVVHLYGQMCDMVGLQRIAKKYNLLLFEDAAHCIEGMRGDVRPGQLSDAAIFSFYATKNITSGEGGAIITNNKKKFELLKKLRVHGMNKSAIDRYKNKYSHWNMDVLGYKCNMNDLQASLLLPQLKNINLNLKKRELAYKHYTSAINEIKNINLPKILKKTRHARHLFTIWVNKKIRDRLLSELQKKNIGVAVNYRAIHTLKYYKKKYNYKNNQFPNALKIGNETISLPLYPSISKKEINFILTILTQTIDKLRKK